MRGIGRQIPGDCFRRWVDHPHVTDHHGGNGLVTAGVLANHGSCLWI